MANSLSPCNDERVLERNRYFTGRLLAAADFEAEQAYFLDKVRGVNRLIGYGTVCGLAVEPMDPPSGSVVVQPGVAVDCCGREIVVSDPIEVELRHEVDAPPARSVYVVLDYGEEAVELVPAPSDGEESMEAARIREIPRVRVTTERPAQGHEETGPDIEGVVPCPDCPDPAVTLARVDLRGRGPVEAASIDNTERRGALAGGGGGREPDDAGQRATAAEIEGLRRRVAVLTLALGGVALGLLGSWMCRRPVR